MAGGLGEVEVFPAAQVHFQRRRLRPRNFEHIELHVFTFVKLNSPGLVMDTRYLRQKESKKSKYLIPTWATREEEKFEAKELKQLQGIV